MRRQKSIAVTIAAVILTCLSPLPPARAQSDAVAEKSFTVEPVEQLGTRRYRHGNMISQVWFTPDRQVVSAGAWTMRIFHPDSGELTNEVRHAVYSKAFFDGDRRVLIGEPLKNGVSTHTFRVVDINTGEQLAEWNSPEWVEQAAFGRGTDFAVLANLNRTISIVDLKTGTERDRIEFAGPKSKEAGRPFVTLSADSSRLAVETRNGFSRFYLLAEDGKVDRLLSTIDPGDFHRIVFSTKTDEVVLLGSQTSSLWNIRTGKQLVRWREPGPNRPSDAVFADDGRTVAELADGVIRVRETQTGKELRSFDVNAMPRLDRLALSPDESVLAAGGFQGRVRLYDFQSGKEVGFVEDEETHGPVEAVAISDDGKWIASAEYTGVVSLWDGANDWQRQTCTDDDIRGKDVYDTNAGPNFLTFLPGESRLLAGSGRSHNSVNLWDAATAKRDAQFIGHTSPITGVVTSRDGRVIVSSGKDLTRVWDRNGTAQTASYPRAKSVSLSPEGARSFTAEFAVLRRGTDRSIRRFASFLSG
ncbi:MAG: WD40 repeat domain-containing protein, partial [Planctomycetota bacterium]|nr:WD40 repeat domain-containing protein [Planctomycetota bacterium]